jgi:RHS repeat-associated protein
VWNGDTLIATIDQVTVNGANSGSSTTRYIHPDHLGSTNVVSDENGSVVQDVEYYPYGETRLNQPTYPTNEQRQYIAQFMDGNSLVYLNARYYDSSRGQFMSEDPVFLAVGNGAQVQNLTQQSQYLLYADPQKLNAYAYGRDNPVMLKDPSGDGPELILAILGIVGVYGWIANSVDVYNAYNADVAHPSGTSPNDKAQANLQFGYDRATGAIASAFTKAGWKRVSPALGVLQATDDVITQGPDAVNYYMSGGFKRDATDVFNWASNVPKVATSLSVVFSNQSTVQARVQAVNTYNAASGASSNQSKLWVTPSGAVVNWSGALISGPTKSH